MALSELYEIGKRSRNPLAGVGRGARRGQGGGSLITILDEESGAGAESEGKSHDDEISREGGSKRAHFPKCMICRIQPSKYNCPSCNIAYCSFPCYQSKKHESCSRPFLQNALEEELGRDGRKQGLVGEEERKAMMDVLRRMKSLGNDGDDFETADEVEGEEEGEELDLGE